MSLQYISPIQAPIASIGLQIFCMYLCIYYIPISNASGTKICQGYYSLRSAIMDILLVNSQAFKFEKINIIQSAIIPVSKYK